MENKTFLQRLLEAQKEIGKVVKNAKNPHFKNNYADVNAIIAAVEPILNSNDILLTQPIEDGYVVSRLTDTQTGEVVESKLPLANQTNPQAMGSQITYYRRYTLQSLLALQVEDDDAQHATNSNTPAPARKPDLKKKIETKDQIDAIADWIKLGKLTIEKAKSKYDFTPAQLTELETILKTK
jgi:hypothetical protein